jgi:hypothetical protein
MIISLCDTVYFYHLVSDCCISHATYVEILLRTHAHFVAHDIELDMHAAKDHFWPVFQVGDMLFTSTGSTVYQIPDRKDVVIRRYLATAVACIVAGVCPFAVIYSLSDSKTTTIRYATSSTMADGDNVQCIGVQRLIHCSALLHIALYCSALLCSYAFLHPRVCSVDLRRCMV